MFGATSRREHVTLHSAFVMYDDCPVTSENLETRRDMIAVHISLVFFEVMVLLWSLSVRNTNSIGTSNVSTDFSKKFDTIVR